MGQIFESVVPYLAYKRRKKEIQAKASSKKVPEGIEQLAPSDGIDEDMRLHAEIEAAKDEFIVSIRHKSGTSYRAKCLPHTPMRRIVKFVRSNLII